MIYSEEVYKKARNLKIRYSLIKLRDQCDFKIENFKENEKYLNIFDWISLKKDFKKLISDYDEGINLNEELILKMYDIKLNDNIISIKRLIKLIRIV
jgi:hypothetical protein